ncbi:prepilin-type N-terminal cleavage/methylation domain-containing protein [bacterium]|nr:prepilin-type N-terminal cleavage/methylation domain-containing protein [bacterium]
MKKILDKIKAGNAGFSLMELIMAMLVMAVLMVAITPLFKTSILTFTQTTAIAESGQSARIAFNRLLLDMKKMDLINSGSSSGISFDDIDGNTVVYAYSGERLLRNGSTAAGDVSGFTIEYIDVDGYVYAAPSDDTWQIKVTLDFDIQGSPASFTAEVSPRNIHFSGHAMDAG